MFPGIKEKFFRKKNMADESENIFWGSRLSLDDRDLKERLRLEWLEDTYLNYSEEELNSTNKNYLGLGISKRRLISFFLVILFAILILFFRGFYLQVVKGDYYLAVAEKNRIRVLNLPSPRGIIYDRNGIPLVKNVPSFALFVVPFDFNSNAEEKEKSMQWFESNLAPEEFAGISEKIEKIKPSEKEYFEPVLVVTDLSFEKAAAMRIESVNYPGISVEVIAKREYATTWKNQPATALGHILGYEGRISPAEYKNLSKNGYLFNDDLGKTGIEEMYESQMRGKYGKEQIEVDSTGKAVKILAQEEVRKGDSVNLSIDLEMQAKLESILQNRLAKMNLRKASAIVMNPQNGQVLSLISLPGYDNNLFAKGISDEDYKKLLQDDANPLFNRVISGEYPSGSTIKPVIGAAALAEKIITERTSFLSIGGIRIGEWFYPDWKAGGHGYTDIRKALAESVNTFFYIVGGGYGETKGLGMLKIKEYSEKFGLNKPTGINLPNEQSGFLPTPEWKKEYKDEQWYIGDTYHAAIGQGDLLVVPLQVANFTSVFANKGTLFKPQIVESIFNQELQRPVKVNPEVLQSEIVDDYIIEVIRQGMRQAVTRGSAVILNSLPVTSAAKTGTAQWQEGKTPHAWFTAFAPYENAELVITILVEEAGEGSAVSAPIAYEFLDWYFRQYRKEELN
ncbi:penicillin-binding protein 2 [Patescibacteria group bacterium]|nr:penicillin-binding protein 2 [Patescibacteria group bacterium]